jgi:hypothetical protein
MTGRISRYNIYIYISYINRRHRRVDSLQMGNGFFALGRGRWGDFSSGLGYRKIARDLLGRFLFPPSSEGLVG